MSYSEKTCALFCTKGQRQNNEISNEGSLFKTVWENKTLSPGGGLSSVDQSPNE